MTPAGLFAAAAALAAVAAIREWIEASGWRIRVRRWQRGMPVRALPEAAARLGLPDRLEAAGLADRVSPRLVLGAKAAGAALGAGVATVSAPVAPGHLGILVGLGLPAAGFLAPDALLDRQARHRWRRMTAALPDALDLLAIGVATGRSVGVVLGDIAAHAGGPLARELGRVATDIDSGRSQAEALAALGRRNQGPEWTALAAALDRSRRHGAPLADQLRDQASALRRDQRRRVEESAARAAPKIQLVVALVLVPSVLLMIVAALVANSDSLLGGFR